MVKLNSFTPNPLPTQRRSDWQATVLSADGLRIPTNTPTDLLPNGVRPLCSCAQCNAIRDHELQSRHQTQPPYRVSQALRPLALAMGIQRPLRSRSVESLVQVLQRYCIR